MSSESANRPPADVEKENEASGQKNSLGSLSREMRIRYVSKKCSNNGQAVALHGDSVFLKTAYRTVRSDPFHYPCHFVPFRRSFLATDPNSMNFAKNLAIPCPVALIPSCCNFRDISPDLRH